MANKKISQRDETVMEENEPEVFQDGDYYTALVKVSGKRELVKIRGIVQEDYDDFYLYNNQHGDELECEDSGFSFGIYIGENTQTALDNADIREFSVVKDKRIMKVIDNDILPEVAGHQARKLSNGSISFGCGAVEVTKDEIKNWLKFMKLLKKQEGIEDFLETVNQITDEIDLDQMLEIDLDDVQKLLD